METLLDEFSRVAKNYLRHLETRSVFPSDEALAGLQAFDMALPEESCDPKEVLTLLDRVGSPATVASSGGRYFGFVIGSSLPAAMAANLLAGVWDQNAGLEAASPVSAFIEEVCIKWLLDAFCLPEDAGVGFVTGATMANFTGLAAARHAVLDAYGWDVEAEGLFGAPPITVIVGEEVHVSVLKALGLLGLGRNRVIRVPTDREGRMRADLIPDTTGPAIICMQGGNVNTGAFDPAEQICQKAKASGAWVHMDGAFGLWAAASPRTSGLLRGFELADSWATDAHKWLNVPYDNGIVIVRDRRHFAAAMSANATYLMEGERREPHHFVPEISRRARGVDVWAALRSLGRKGLADLVERNCRQAVRFAQGLNAAGYEVLNDVVLNQVLVSFGEAGITNRVIGRIQEDGTCWCGGTLWQGRTAMRISVSSWRTTDEDIARSLDAVLRIAEEERARQTG